MRLPGLAVGLAPWLLYLVMPHPADSGALIYLGATATVVAGALTWWARARSRTTLLGSAATWTFAAVTVAALVGGESARDWLRTYSPAATLWVLAAVMVLSIRTVPFTERYARQSLPESYWHSPLLHAINRRISLVWAGCTLVAAVSVTAAATVGVRVPTARVPAGGLAPYLALSLAWVVPVAAILVACRYTDFATNSSAGRASP